MWAVLTDGRWKLPFTYCNTWVVITWYIAAERLRTFYTLQNAGQQHCKHHSDSGKHVTWLPVIALEVITVCVLKIGFVKHNLLFWVFLGVCVPDVCWLIFSIILHKLNFSQSLLHTTVVLGECGFFTSLIQFFLCCIS